MLTESAPSGYKYFDGTIFANVYDGVKQIELPKTLKILGFEDASHPSIPRRNDNYVFRSEVLRDILGFLRKPNGDALYLVGPTGSGKTSVINETCARLNWPMDELTLNSRFEFNELIGQFVYQASTPGATPTMVWQEGPLPRAMKQGHVLVLNEIDLADPGELAGLNDILEGRPLVVTENAGEVIRPHPMFRVVVTANSCGNGDGTGRYAGVQQQNIAFLDRFRFVEIGYQEATVEEHLLETVAPAMNAVLPAMVQLANEVRDLFRKGQISITLSTRTLIRWAQISSDFRNSPNALEYGLKRALLIRAEEEEAKAVMNLCTTVFGEAWDKAAKAKNR